MKLRRILYLVLLNELRGALMILPLLLKWLQH
jgi:hypothetical protein